MIQTEQDLMRLVLTSMRAEEKLTPEKRKLYEDGCNLRDQLGFGLEGSAPENDERILNLVNKVFPGFDAVMEEWAKLQEGFMNEGDTSPN